MSAVDYMQRALDLARKAQGTTSPNPAVGAVVVRDDRIVGEGWTQPPGGPHAEAVALRQAGAQARGATLYVTLEPCSFYGRTPPCTRAIIEAGIVEVHFSHTDPDERSRGRGRDELIAAGLKVFEGEGEQEARRLNEAYIKHRSSGLPFVIAKFALSLDGKIAAASGDARWVSGPAAREWSHRLRTSIDAIMVGVNTVLTDDPQLTARPGGRTDGAGQPLRVIADSRGRTPLSAQVLRGPARTLIATTEQSSAAWRQAVVDAGAEAVIVRRGERGIDLNALLRELGRRDVLSLLVEGGGTLLGSFFDQRLVDKVHAVVAPVIIGAAAAPSAVAGRGADTMAEALRLADVTVERLGDDVLITGYSGCGAQAVGTK